MKHLKTYENNKNEPKVGDYVVCEEYIDDNAVGDKVNAIIFINNNIGKIVFVKPTITFDYLVKYKINWNTCGFTSTSFQLGKDPDGCRNMYKGDIKYWSKKKKDCEAYLKMKKYNL